MKSPQAIAKIIGIPLEDWPGRCYAIATQMLQHKLAQGDVCYGLYHGPIHPDSLFKNRPMTHHGWIEQPGQFIIDPTRWVFECAKPYIYQGQNQGEYDFGGNDYRASTMPPCPYYNGIQPASITRLPAQAKSVVQFLVNAPRAKNVSLDQRFWIANAPLNLLQGQAKPIYRWLEKNGAKAYIPFDNWRKVMESR